jgi:plasmid stability protein
MATMTVRKIDDGDYARFIAFARSNNRSAAAEIREFIANAGKVAGRRAIVQDLRAFQAETKAKHGVLSDSTDLIRQMRDEE